MKNRLESIRRFIKLQEQMRRVNLIDLAGCESRIAELSESQVKMLEHMSGDGALSDLSWAAAARRLEAIARHLDEAHSHRRAVEEITTEQSVNKRGGERLLERLERKAAQTQGNRTLESIIEVALASRLQATGKADKR